MPKEFIPIGRHFIVLGAFFAKFKLKMKYLNVLFLIFFINSLFAQNKVVGKYGDHFGNEIRLYNNLTFEYFSRSDSSLSWTYGTWENIKDTINFLPLSVFDSVLINRLNKIVLSIKKKSESQLFMPKLKTYRNSDFQNKINISNKVFYRNKMLFELDEKGNLVIEKIYAPWIRNYLEPQFYKL